MLWSSARLRCDSRIRATKPSQSGLSRAAAPAATLSRFEIQNGLRAGRMNCPILIAGRRGRIAHVLIEQARRLGPPVEALGRPCLDIEDADSIARAIDSVEPCAIVNAAGYVAPDEAESDPELASWCARPGSTARTARTFSPPCCGWPKARTRYGWSPINMAARPPTPSLRMRFSP